MKKRNYRKWVTVFFATILLLIITRPLSVEASASKAWQTLTHLTAESDKGINQVEGEVVFDLQGDGQPLELGKLTLQAYLVENPVSFQIFYNLQTPLMQGETLGFEVYGKEGYSYRYSTALGEWQVTPWQKDQVDLLDLAPASSSSASDLMASPLSEDLKAFIDDYFELETTETDYVFKLKQDIDGRAFFEALNQFIDFNQMIDDSVAATQQQADQLGIEMDEEYGPLMKEVLKPESFAAFFDHQPTFRVSFQRTNGLIHQLHFSVKQAEKLLESSHPIQSQKGSTRPLGIQVDLTFERNDQLPPVEIPAEALDLQEVEDQDQ